ncbi:ABC transporter ATP-binding protein [Streptomyces sp. MST-110588]|uniref:ABC transporter ATP-binding protein n=1 Tax=Streptomyces sp. MST-110588 TaxID=2833628 RepID=UPI001F5D8619|nr:ABC transporter ATP-binding protein [Streptomyces sp. MST-110588]UNO43162.1 ABC transporter ATP-binding protein [Streptomyces sp. MST-110588]
MLRMVGAGRSFGERAALCPVDLEVPAGTCVALLGRNGSGKSTLLRLACGRDRPTTGTVEWDGSPMTEDDPRLRRRIAVVGDTLSCYPDLTVRQHLELVAIGHGVPDADARVQEALERQRLTGRQDARPGALSSGQLQSMLLAAALLRPRDLLILDEPEQRLDPAARRRLRDVLRAETERGTTVLFATHHQELAREAADRVLVLEDGVVIADGSPEQALARVEL